ncbi:Eukaryotic aspartyl protease family protein [Drechmeria coniospora]|uniref:Eukaryotic aspartyl protease family protein n=1 Tax=Drechmeria coniospora TaxID=98403 RepID=A0A151GR87_DRECN|nr:Eukaryotic aspartyl protease family protein [Drechmeria coniospora]KYK59578.1 Eukaryotic aspartyl protease family protein [Drechmeria coniospora]
MRSSKPALFAAAATLLATFARALDPAPLSLQQGDWLGIDGNWSTVLFLLGSNSDVVNVLPSTGLSEFWTIGPGGCSGKDPTCNTARGGIHDPLTSKHWSSMGPWELGLGYVGVKGNGQYGLDTLNGLSPATDIGFGMSNVLLSVINVTDPFLGMFGLGIQTGRFSNSVVDSPLTQAVKAFGWIPSYSYAYTAGAHYRGAPVSATLGGYDTTRFVSHANNFTLNLAEGIPRPLVRGIQIAAKTVQDKPAQWTSLTQILSDWNTTFLPLIDSSTPYLWLPEPICDRFARALNLTYNSTFELYTLSNTQYRDFTSQDALTFTFTFTSYDNHNDFGLPLSVPGAVNITLPLKAFVGLLEYPFQGGAIKYGAPAVPYFTLKKAPGNETIIGRSFLQEAYLITRYDEASFSIHQARYPSMDANPNLVPIRQPSNSPFDPPPKPFNGAVLSTAQMVGVVLGAVFLCLAIFLSLCYCCCYRKRGPRQTKDTVEVDDQKDSTSTIVPDSPRTPVSRLLSKIGRRRRSRRIATGAGDAIQMPYEAPDCQIYELPASPLPAELDACGGDDMSFLGKTELGTDYSYYLSAYQLAKREMDRQLQGPVPAYSPPADGMALPSEKPVPDISPDQMMLPMDEPSPVSPTRSRGAESASNTFASASEPSPISPRLEWNTVELPSPATASLPHRRSLSVGTGVGSVHINPQLVGTDWSHSTQSTASVSAMGESASLSATSQRTPIGPSNVICLGPLPDYVQLRRHSIMPHMAGSDERGILANMFNAASIPSEGSLGSNYTEEEDRIFEEMTRQASHSQGQSTSVANEGSSSGWNREALEPQPSHAEQQLEQHSRNESGSERGRIDPGRDLVHVPQMAAKRYSWEEE